MSNLLCCIYLYDAIFTLLGGVVVSEVVRSPPTASKQRLQRAAMHQLPKTDFPIVKVCIYVVHV